MSGPACWAHFPLRGLFSSGVRDKLVSRIPACAGGQGLSPAVCQILKHPQIAATMVGGMSSQLTAKFKLFVLDPVADPPHTRPLSVFQSFGQSCGPFAPNDAQNVSGSVVELAQNRGALWSNRSREACETVRNVDRSLHFGHISASVQLQISLASPSVQVGRDH